ncbi:MAG: glycosyltransferase [Candidatus Andersenbacteria bacterium]|nr:glycosyltransferase [Candidatus Andersenbacteria bacterium]MBI3250884.1 glycosyltransferase [Candidatus Andersenbacteria bacterium]
MKYTIAVPEYAPPEEGTNAPFSDIPLRYSSHRLFSKWQLLALGVIGVAIAISLVSAFTLTLKVGISLLSLVYLLDLLFGFFLIYRALRKDPELHISAEQMTRLKNKKLPLYTILCPLFGEAKVVPQFIKAIQDLDYPKEKLQVILLLEEEDDETIAAVKNSSLPRHFEVIVVPSGQPQTKPRACNVGLLQARGKYVVIYDAEDIPDPDQLKKAVVAFSHLPKEVICIQAKLDFYNRSHNLITRLFTAEYALLFNLTLLGLQSINGPIPLGGTSNHFRTFALRRIGGWDPFNVTEDCDLGIRLFTQGYRTAIIDSTTLEEANSQLLNWIRQRSRWIKGYFQTLIVHTRTPQHFFRSFRTIPHLATFLLVVGGKTIAVVVNPFLWALTLVYFLGPEEFQLFVKSLYLAPIFYIAAATWIAGNILNVLYYLLGVLQRGYPELVKFFPLVPLYWLMMSVAASKAFYQLLVKPHFWEKTIHGFHLEDQTKVRWRFLPERRYEKEANSL